MNGQRTNRTPGQQEAVGLQGARRETSFTNDLQQFNARFAEYTSHELKEGYYNLNGDLYYKGHKVQSGEHSLPVYETHRDARTGKTVNVQKKHSPVWILIVIILMFLLPCTISFIQALVSLFD